MNCKPANREIGAHAKANAKTANREIGVPRDCKTEKIRKRLRPRPATLPGVCPRSITNIDAETPEKVSSNG